jgi:hypothetical protein
VEESTGGEPLIAAPYFYPEVFELPLRLTSAEVGPFKLFHRDGARGMANPFTYTDVLGVATSVRFADPNLPEIRERAYNLFEATARLRKV